MIKIRFLKDIFERNEELKQNLYKKLLPKKAYLRVYLDNDTHACKVLIILVFYTDNI